MDKISATLDDDATHINNNDESPISALKRLANSDYAVEPVSTSRFMTDNLGVDSDTGQTLEHRVKSFQKHLAKQIADYVQVARKRTHTADNCLFVLNGWEYNSSAPTNPTLVPEKKRKTCGGYYMRWQGKGIVINPGTDFLAHFHRQGLHVTDIDCVIVTQDNPDTYCDIEAIYNLNYQLNANSSSNELHIIQYYLNQHAHQNIAAQLKPNFKQERNTVHSLTLFVDSPDIEKMDLFPEICLHYFHTSLPDANRTQQGKEESHPCLGIRLECKGPENRIASTIGYISGIPWSPLLAHNLGRCDLLITGFDNTCASDYGKVQYNDECLGYFGTYSLVEEVAPRLLLCCEFGGREGDIRLEIVKKMRQEYAYSHHQGTVILPGDTGLYLDLRALQVRCSISKKLVDPSQIRIARTNEAFGKLEYLAPSCII